MKGLSRAIQYALLALLLWVFSYPIYVRMTQSGRQKICDHVVQKLEQHREKNASYPNSLKAIDVEGADVCYYTPSGNTYRLWFTGGLLGVRYYDPANQQWQDD